MGLCVLSIYNGGSMSLEIAFYNVAFITITITLLLLVGVL